MYGCKYEPTTKNDLAVDCISREQAKAAIRDKFKDLPSRVEINTILNDLPSVTPQEPRWIPISEKLPEDSGEYVEAIPKAEYEARLKADMVAMLTNLQLEIEELDTPNNGSAYMDCVEIIQQKIDALKGEQEAADDKK